jgi:hypothetical protein
MSRSYQTGQWQCCLNLINAPKLDSAVKLWSIDQVKLASTLLSSDFSTFPTHSLFHEMSFAVFKISAAMCILSLM